MSSRYNLRHLRATSPTTGTGNTVAQAEQSGEHTVLEPQVTPHDSPASPAVLEGGSDVESNAGSHHSGSERRSGVSYSQAVSSSLPSPTPSVVQETASAVGSSTPVAELPINVSNNRKHRVTVEEVTDDDEQHGPWIEVQCRRRARSAGSLPPLRNSVSAQDSPALTTQQLRAVKTAEANLTPVDRECFERRMDIVRNDVHSVSTSSRGEGPSIWEKGKAVDARNWGGLGVPHDELDPDVQRRELDKYTTARSISNNILDGYNSDEQRDMLAHWQARKQTTVPPADNVEVIPF